ncbi:hypothetical protein SDC9_68883 [bioreactor metagenome]|jgi:hypothetical protein|uniref:Uncharacterized protein n=2 Tax=root TaxID=1 RepID=R9CKT9_9CLOT|nr:hypothetical protein [Clostridium sartagoforme]EOR27791.1 hypothetical protein A500_02721 [Clostridium sartagoforme AAU1]
MKSKKSTIIILVLIITNIITVCYSMLYQNNIIKSLTTDLTITQNELSQNRSLVEKEKYIYELRNVLDSNFYLILNSAIKGDYISIKDNLADDVTIENGHIKGLNFDFTIPQENMSLRQRMYDLVSDTEFRSIYEIYDSGYSNEPKYDARLYTLNVKFSQVDGNWKLNFISIDE